MGRYFNIWCPSNYKNKLLQSLWDGFSRVCLYHSPWLVLLPPWLWECSSGLPGHRVCPHGLSARQNPSLPLNRGSAHVTRPE